MEVFVAVADAGGFARAGKRLGMSAPAVTRAVATLEERLGASLFNRTTRSVSLTEAGDRFLADARRLLGEIVAAEREVVGEAAAPRGHLVITAPVTFGRLALAPCLGRFLDAYPQITASLLLFDRVVNLVEEGIDVAVRIGEATGQSLIVRRVGSVRKILAASPDYLARRGTPQTPGELGAHTLVGFTGLVEGREWRLADGARTVAVPVRPRFEVNDAMTALAAAEAGEGIVPALSYMTADAFRAGRLVPVLARCASPPMPVQLVWPQSRLLAPKVRAFVDFAAPRLSEALSAAMPSTAAG